MRFFSLTYFLTILASATLSFQSTKLSAKELIACGHPYYPPVSWVQDQQLIGIAPAVVTLIFSELGYQVRLDTVGNWKRCLWEVKTGHADIVVAAYRIDSRKSDFAFSQQHIVDDPIGIFVNPSKSGSYHSLNDLKGKTAGLLFGDSFGDSLDEFIHYYNQIENVSEGKQNFKKLAYGRIDFMPLGLVSGNLQTQKLGYSKQVVAASIKLETNYYYMALSQHSGLSLYLPYINRRLKQLHENGAIEQLLTEYSDIYLNSMTEADIP